MTNRASQIKKAINIPINASAEIQQSIKSIEERFKFVDRQITSIEEVAAETEAEISGDTTPPLPITGLTATKFETHIRLSWTNSLSSDASHVLITKTIDTVPDPETIFVAHPTNFYDDLDEVATSDYVYNLVVIDTSANESSAVEVSVTAAELPAPDAVLNKTWSGDDLETYWDPVDGFGVTGYQVDVYHGLVLARTTNVTSPKYKYTYAENGADGLVYEVTIRLYTLDADCNPSTSYAESTITHVAPSPVLNLVTSVVEAGFVITWNLLTSSDILGYVISLNGVIVEYNHTTASYLYKTLLLAGDYSFSVMSKNKFGQLSIASVAPYTVNGPAAPTIFTAQVIDNSITLYWGPPAVIELPIAEYEIRKGDVFATAVVVGRKKGTFTIIDEAISGTFKYWVAAVDNATNIGTGTSLVASVDEPPDFVLNVRWVNDFADGAPTNYLIRADGSAIAPYDITQTWEDHFIGTGSGASPQFADVQDLIDAGYTYLPEPVPLTAEYYEEHDYGTVLSASSITSTYDEDQFNDGPVVVTKLASKELVGDAYVDQTATKIFAINFRYIRDKFELTSATDKDFSVFSTHTLQLDSKLKSDAGNGTVTDAANGLVVTFTKNFVDVISLTATPTGDGSAGLMQVIDYDYAAYSNTFTYYLFDDTGTKVTGSFAWVAKGY